jgi:Xaa-Pro aminopeptidase
MTQDNIEKLGALANDELREGLWLWFSADGSDRLFDIYITDKYSSPTYAFVYRKSIQLVVASLDADIDFGISAKAYSTPESLAKLLSGEFAKAQWPMKVFLNYSQSGDPKGDSLRHGVFVSLVNRISQMYASAGHAQPLFESAENLFYALIERRSAKQIEHMKIAAERAVAILRTSFTKIRAGMSEQDIFCLVQTRMHDTQREFLDTYKVSGETYSWNKDSCPIVLVGPNLQKGGHAETSSYRVTEGETIYADFGVKLTFPDGGTVSSDLQRMAYLPRYNEQNAPAEVQRVFDTLVGAIDKGVKAMKPGTCGYEIDRIVRGDIIRAGFPDYDHSTGHPIGEVAHSPGALIGVMEKPRAQRRIQKWGTYTIEPRCQVPNGGSIEEMVLVTDDGGRTLCQPQTELWIIGRNI